LVIERPIQNKIHEVLQKYPNWNSTEPSVISYIRVVGRSPIGHSPMAKVRGCIGESPRMYWRNSRGRVGESTLDFRHWRKSLLAKILLAKFRNPLEYDRFEDEESNDINRKMFR